MNLNDIEILMYSKKNLPCFEVWCCAEFINGAQHLTARTYLLLIHIENWKVAGFDSYFIFCLEQLYTAHVKLSL